MDAFFEAISNFLRNYFYIVFYLVFLAAYAVFSLAAFYHCLEYGYAGDATKFMMSLYSLISVAIIVGTFILIFTI